MPMKPTRINYACAVINILFLVKPITSYFVAKYITYKVKEAKDYIQLKGTIR